MDNLNGFDGLRIRGAQKYSHFQETTYRSVKKCASSSTYLFFLLILFIAVTLHWLNISVTTGYSLLEAIHTSKTSKKSLNYQPFEYNLNCSNEISTKKCRINNTLSPPRSGDLFGGMCPNYFRWIGEDLKWWKKTGITKEMMERAKDVAQFRLLIVEGRAYVERIKQSYQTRDIFTIWGILQLIRLYPGKIPDLELLFDCDDPPTVKKDDNQGPNATWPPPLFRYSADQSTLDIVFPDWTFWGWAEMNIRPWERILKEIEEGNNRTKWKDREPYAYWKGNPRVAWNRYYLLKCNSSQYSAHLYRQDWVKEIKGGYMNSKLKDQCTHRYKIYIEGRAWSASDKYILACDSTTLVVEPVYYDFFLRSLIPMQHYWPIKRDRKCNDIKFAVNWGNNHIHEAEAIGKEGTKFVYENLKMKYVYDYMFHLLIEYAKLLKFKPTVSPGMKELCLETMFCSKDGLWRKFMAESMVKSPSDTLPCTIPPPFDDVSLQAFSEKKDRLKHQVEILESEYTGKN